MSVTKGVTTSVTMCVTISVTLSVRVGVNDFMIVFIPNHSTQPIITINSLIN